MSASIWFLSAALALTGPDNGESPGRRAAGQFEVENAIVTFIDEIDVAAQEPGLLTEVKVREGAEVKADDQMAQINDSKAQVAKKVAQAEHEVALAEATNDISVRYADKAQEVAHFDFEAHRDANKQAPGSTPKAEMMKLLLQWQKGMLEVDKAQLELDVAKLTAKVKEASVEAADDDIHRRRVLSPIDAVVIEVYRHVGEWVNPGDRIVRLVRMKTLRVEGMLRLADVAPTHVKDRPVTVNVTLTGNRSVEFKGQIVFVAPELQPGDKYRVIAEVENREEHGIWLLMPGMKPAMKVDAGVAAEKPKASRR
ncbi:MAG: hypothetical protein B7Z73_09405 [Planctomycetia bacterium 21-64-5]|nr:MAG: hypothetical protein B7Z73_09405 [Planctomycetia bacterium 21-64-5]HQU42926.1 HlyD family efflux transporter periplasmic adaptor subunit [Pirellulales bacterium]